MGRERPAPPAGCDANREATAPLDFLVIEYLDGETLAARIARQPPSRSEALAIAIQIASAVDRAHAHGIVHRDLKPGNVMLTRGARRGAPSTSGVTPTHVKLLDFVLARLTGVGAQWQSAADSWE